MMRLGMLLGCLALAECAPPPQAQKHSLRGSTTPKPKDAQPTGTGPAIGWSNDTRSPNPAPIPKVLGDVVTRCGEWDERLGSVATWLAKRGSVGGYSNDIDQLTFALRVAGTPYVWPAAWSRIAKSDEGEDEMSLALSRWLLGLEQGPLRRCGMARLELAGRSVLVAVTSMAPADLTLPLPTRARVGQWLDFQAKLRSDASLAKVILLPPTGEPMSVPTHQEGDIVKARFAAASPGQWLVQLLASGESGPRPMLEATLFVDVAPSTSFHDQPVPGEDAAPGNTSSEQALDRMVAAMRRETGRPALRRDRDLDRLALEHARSMRLARRIGHDVGDGPTHERLASADLRARLAGENVAHAADAARAHRALWASPSHRSNLLHRGFSRWGLGVVRDADGSLWVCELFASDR
jgi:uncharacterized protein YkwD